jgi:fructoselysine-6-P-deglycase FrlB-like protein
MIMIVRDTCCAMSESGIYCAQMSVTLREIQSQPALWRQAAEMLPAVAAQLPWQEQAIAIVGCGTSYYIGQAVAAARETRGIGRSDAFVASEMPATRRHDLVIAISRSGTTTEVVRALRSLPSGTPSLAISAVADTPVVETADDAILLSFADETSIVQTRFATTVLALMLAHFGQDLQRPISDAEAALSRPLPADPSEFEQFVFLGRGWTIGLASEAALKFREAAGAWAEAYPAMEYRHGPISVASSETLVWCLGEVEEALVSDIEATGASVIQDASDPMASLVMLQRTAVALAEARGLDPDRPQHLSRSVVLPSTDGGSR